jgi:WD40 repeat protein
LVCTTGYITRVWSLRTGESCLTLSHGDNVKVTALAFAPTADAENEGQRLWLGTNIGEIHEVDIPSQSIVRTKSNAHPRREIIRIFRHASELWSLDDDGKLNVWSPGSAGMPSLDTVPTTFRAMRGHSCSVIVGGHLWLAAGKEIRVFKPSAPTEAAFNVLQKPLLAEGAGDITAGAIIPNKPDLVYFGHADGKVSVFQHRDFKCVGVFSVSPYKISSLAGAGDYLWAGYTAGTIFVYDTSTTPWRVVKDWVAHDNPICNILTDTQSIWKMDNRLQVVSLGLDNAIRLWDGMLREDWLETKMQQNDNEFCSFEEITAGVLTWNAGAVKPNHLKGNERDAAFFKDYFSSHTPPDILIFGFQELVDLENKKVTASEYTLFCSASAAITDNLGRELFQE